VLQPFVRQEAHVDLIPFNTFDILKWTALPVEYCWAAYFSVTALLAV
jgi:hypothetical protein